MSETYNAGDLGRLRERAFAHASTKKIPYDGLEMIFQRDLTHTEDVWLSEYIHAYRLPGSDNVALVWGLSDGANNSGGFSTGLREIPREDYEALLEALKALRPDHVAWCAADAGMGRPYPQRRAGEPNAAPASRRGAPEERQKGRASGFPQGLAAVAAGFSALCALSPRLAPDEGAHTMLFGGSFFVMLILIVVISACNRGNKLKVLIDLLLTAALIALASIGGR